MAETLKAAVRPIYWRARRYDWQAWTAVQRARRAAFLARVRAAAAWQRAEVELDVASDVWFGADVRVELAPESHNVLRIGSRSVLEAGVAIGLKGGQVLLGPRSLLRRRVTLNVTGRLETAGDVVLSWGTTVHCGESVRLERYVGAAEYVTITDSTHYFTEPDTWFWHNLRTAPVVVGGNTWLCPRAQVNPGTTLGAYCIVGANTVVSGTVPDGHLATGSPARVRPMRLPWERAQAAVRAGAAAPDDLVGAQP